MAVSTLAVCTFLGVLALIQHFRNAPEDSARIEKDVVAQIRSDEKRRALDAEFEAERQAKLRPTPQPEETLTPNTWKPEAPGNYLIITLEH